MSRWSGKRYLRIKRRHTGSLTGNLLLLKLYGTNYCVLQSLQIPEIFKDSAARWGSWSAHTWHTRMTEWLVCMCPLYFWQLSAKWNAHAGSHKQRQLVSNESSPHNSIWKSLWISTNFPISTKLCSPLRLWSYWCCSLLLSGSTCLQYSGVWGHILKRIKGRP